MHDSESSRSVAPECGCAGRDAAHVTRRAFVGVAAGAIAAVPLQAGAHQSTPQTEQPVATPAGKVAIDLDRLKEVSSALVGGGTLADNALETLGGLISADPAAIAAFDGLAAVDDPASADAMDAMSGDERALVENILEFWYLGNFDGKPVENRADLYFGLPVWATLPYVSQPTLCKAFGYWATDIQID
jgi:hypothetical protein